MVPVIDVLSLHEKYHRTLLRRKDPNELWKTPFENALIGYIIANHKNPEGNLLEEIKNWLNRWFNSVKRFMTFREIATGSLYSSLLYITGDIELGEKVAQKVNEALFDYVRKSLEKFSIFSYPELCFYSFLNLSYYRNFITDEIFNKIIEVLIREATNNWRDKIVRFAFFSALTIELGIDDQIILDKIARKLLSIQLNQIKDYYDIIVIMWFLSKFKIELCKIVGDSLVVSKKLDQALQQFVSIESFFTTVIDEESNLYYLTTFQLALIDDALSSIEHEYHKVNPNVLFDMLDIHPVIKRACEKLFKDGYYTQAILEAYKALNNYVKKKSGRSDLDGFKLATVFAVKVDQLGNIIKEPILKINDLKTQSDIDEQEGIMHLFMGAMKGVRNPRAHEEKRLDDEDPFRVIELLCLASFLAKKVDDAR